MVTFAGRFRTAKRVFWESISGDITPEGCKYGIVEKLFSAPRRVLGAGKRILPLNKISTLHILSTFHEFWCLCLGSAFAGSALAASHATML